MAPAEVYDAPNCRGACAAAGCARVTERGGGWLARGVRHSDVRAFANRRIGGLADGYLYFVSGISDGGMGSD
ncbi:hypothetical protein Pen02_27090 [Plantactinospora endophytica]|uniref:Uncharacterized protein n=1 Tax=Plantactinospora endophytica TaxID=673535 RepID=A0ABQ4DZ92_9ACTN|nr:hypothetical protein Pen02_27090 [Plantactinospora endophytica]